MSFARVWSRKTFSAGAPIFREGDHGRTAYLIEAGRVELFIGDGADRRDLGVLGPSELFGEMALVDKGRRSASARALEDTVCVVLQEQDLDRALERADPFLRNLALVLSRRLRESNRKIDRDGAFPGLAAA